MSNAHLVQFLQQEKIQLDKTLTASHQDVQRLVSVVNTMASLYWSSQTIWQEPQSLDMLDQLLAQCINAVGATDGSISILDESKNELVFLIVHGLVREQLTNFRIGAGSGIAGWVIESGETVIIDDARQDWRFSMVVDEAFSFSTRSMLCVPILDDGNRIGVIQWLNKKQNQHFDESDLTVAKVLSDIAAKVIRMQVDQFAG